MAQKAMEMAVEYARERKQFGRPIGSYQAVSHRCAQMLLEVEGSRSGAYYAAWCADAEPESLPAAASGAKAYSSDAGWRVCGSSLQVHGGIGFTWEHDLHFFLKRAKTNAMLYGSAREHRERVASLALAEPEGDRRRLTNADGPSRRRARRAGRWRVGRGGTSARLVARPHRENLRAAGARLEPFVRRGLVARPRVGLLPVGLRCAAAGALVRAAVEAGARGEAGAGAMPRVPSSGPPSKRVPAGSCCCVRRLRLRRRSLALSSSFARITTAAASATIATRAAASSARTAL